MNTENTDSKTEITDLNMVISDSNTIRIPKLSIRIGLALDTLASYNLLASLL